MQTPPGMGLTAGHPRSCRGRPNASGEDVQVSGIGAGAVLTFVGPAVARDEVQRLATPGFQGAIIAVTGAVLAVVTVAASLVSLAGACLRRRPLSLSPS